MACPWYIAGTPWWSLYGPGIACPYGSFGDHFGLSLSAAVGALIKCSVYRESPLGGLVAIAEFLNVVKKDQMDSVAHGISLSVALRTKGLERRHLNKIAQEVTVSIHPTETRDTWKTHPTVAISCPPFRCFEFCCGHLLWFRVPQPSP